MKIYYSKTSLKYLQKIEQNVSQKIIGAIDELPDEGDIVKLKGKKIENLCRLRFGKHRVLYVLDKEIIKVVKIDTRGDVYK
jgi:mRNA-degrading endonuclease RelE of RelBE toxin-antitoxin system